MYETTIKIPMPWKLPSSIRNSKWSKGYMFSFGNRLVRASILAQGLYIVTAMSASAVGLADHLKTDPDLTLFSAALEQSGLIDQFGNGAEHTIFVPSDVALRNEGMAFLIGNVLLTESNSTRLTTLLSYHIVPGLRLEPETISGHVVLTTLSHELMPVVRAGDALSVAAGSGSSFVTRKIETDDGVIFVVDRLLWPDWQTWPEDPVAVALH